MPRFLNIHSIQLGTILSDIESWLSNTLGAVNKISASSIFGQLLTVISNVSHNIVTYIEDALTEQNKYTASRRKSIYGLAAQSGYKPSLGKAAGVWLRIASKPHNGTALDAILTNHTKLLCTQNGLTYSLILENAATTLKCDTNLANQYFYALEGKFETQRFVTNGGKLQAVNVQYNSYIDISQMEVKVNGTVFDECASMYDMNPNANQYYVSYNPTGGVDVCFGNGKYGVILNDGDIIDVTYLIHNGTAGNVEPDENTYFIFQESLKDITGGELDGNSMFDIKMYTEDSVASGSDAEDTGQVSRMIGYNSRSLVLCDANSYKVELGKYSFVGFNKTISEPGSNLIKSTVMKNYKANIESGSDYFNLTDEDFFLSDMQKTSIENALTNSGAQLAGSSYVINDMNLKKYALFVYIRLKNNQADQTLVETKIKNAVGEFFGDIENDDYIPMSDISQCILENCDEIDGVNLYVLSKDNEEALMNGYYYETKQTYDPSNGTFKKTTTRVPVFSGENPNLGLDKFGNIVLENSDDFPVLMGGWKWLSDNNEEITAQPITIVFE